MGRHEERGCRCHSFVRYSALWPMKCLGSVDECSGDFTLYDHLLDHSYNFGVIPERYESQKLSPLDTYFAMGRGRQDREKGIDVVASEMGKL